MNAVSLFAGAGGFDLGFAAAGVRVTHQVENNPAAQRVLQRRFPDIARHDDVRTFCDGSTQSVRCGVLTGGFPCQDLSVAGRRAGLAGERSGLFHEFMRIARALAPRWVLIENVPGLLSSDHGRDMLTVLGTLAELGYGTAYRVLDAQWFGVAQQRRRVFIVGRAGGDWRRAAEVLFERESLPWDSPPSREARADVARCLTAGSGTSGGHRYDADADTENLIPFDPTQVTSPHNRSNPQPGSPCHTLPAAGHPPAVAYGIRSDATREGTAKTPSADAEGRVRLRDPGLGIKEEIAPTCDASAAHIVAYQCHGSNVGPMGTLRRGNGNVTGGVPFVCDRSAVRRLTPRECERLQGFPDDWTAGESDTARYRLMGNAVAVPVAAWIARRIVAADALSDYLTTSL